MPRLVINPGTPQAWEIQLKPGLNFLGRGASNDFKLEDPSISGSHCQIAVDNESTVIKDMGSTNGTYVNLAKIQESRLESGQPLRLGSLDMIFYTDGPDAVTTNQGPPPPAAPPTPLKPGISIRLAALSHAPAPAATDAPPIPPALEIESLAASGPRYCKFHPKAPARFLCNKCNRTFCDLCVTTRNTGGKVIKVCRSCGVECVPVEFKRAATKGFYAGLPGAFIYPFKGAGIIIVIGATVVFAALGFVGWLFVKIALYGLVFLFMQNIIHTTTSDESEPLSFPDVNSIWSAAFQLFGTILASFWLAIGLTIAKLFDVPIPVEAIVASVILGGIYFPMAFLAVAMKDSVAAANPLVVLPAIMKVPVQYGITAILLLTVFGVRQLGSILSSGAGNITLTTKDMSVLLMALGFKMLWALASIYLLTVTMRILGLFYNSNKDKLGWFSR
jgi:hypothetical protein